jgi:hypothetical protein
MGVDIYGISPKFKSEKPQLVPESASEEEKEAYFKALDQFEEDNPGYYFRANWWSWRPIHMLADLAIKVADLSLSTEGWGENGGDGLKTQGECDLLADAMDVYLTLNHKQMSEDDDRIYLCMESWVRQTGGFIDADLEEELSKDNPFGTIMYSGVIDSTGELAFPAHSASLGHIKEFITFLRNCGGFQIF